MNNAWMKARQTKFAAYTIGLRADRGGGGGRREFSRQPLQQELRHDFGQQKFTLSDQTLKIAKNLKQPVTITYWDQPTKFQGAHDLLDRYKNLSPKIDVEVHGYRQEADAGHGGRREDAGDHFRQRRQQAAGSQDR